ncbi:unnamed protein product [Linum tenue]|nr:unnamed protein product [Linum tenue]
MRRFSGIPHLRRLKEISYGSKEASWRDSIRLEFMDSVAMDVV